MLEFSAQQVAILDRLVEKGFIPVAFPLYANSIGIRKDECAALLEPVSGGGFRLYGEPCVLIDRNLTVRVTQNGQSWFVWKKQRLEATPERLATLGQFVSELRSQLEHQI